MRPETRRWALGACLLALAYLGLTFLFTYPLALHVGSHHAGESGGDAKIYLWSYWWTRTALLDLGASPFATDAIFHPIGIGLSFHTLAFSQGLVFTVLSAVSSDVAAANLVVLGTFLASGLASFALARKAGADPLGSFLAGVVFAFCPYRLARLAGHYDLLGTEWIPLYLLALSHLFERERFGRTPAVLAAAAAAACGYTALSYLVFLGLLTLLFLAARARRLPALLPRALLVGGLTVVLLSPLLYQAAVDRSTWTYLPYPGGDRYVADLTAYLVPSPRQTLLGPLIGRAFDENVTETTVYAGLLVAALTGVGVVLRRRIEGASFWLVAAFVFFVLSLGSSLHIAGSDTGVPLPFGLLSRIPLLDELRAPSRFGIVTVLSLAVVTALVWSRLTGRWRHRELATVAVTALLTAEYLALPAPIFAAGAHPVYRRLAAIEDDVTVVEIPGIEQAPVETMYHQTIHGKPIFIGTAARVPREKSDYFFGLPLVRPLVDLRKGRIGLDPELVETQRRSAPEVARFLGLGYFVVDRGYEKRGVVSFLEDVLPVSRWYEDERLVVLETRREELPPDPTTLDPGALHSRQHFESGWLRPEADGARGFRWANRERATILFRRPSPPPDAIVLVVSPLEGLAQTVTASLDGRKLGSRELAPGWQELVLPLPPAPSRRAVERLSLRFSALRTASERDPRTLAARVTAVRFEDRFPP